MTASRLTTTMSAAKERLINHAAGSHGVSGIFVKYDTSSLMVTVSEQHMPLWQFLVRLCGIIGGIFSTTGEWAWTFRAKQLNMVLALNSCSYFILFFFFTVLFSLLRDASRARWLLFWCHLLPLQTGTLQAWRGAKPGRTAAPDE